MSTRVRMQLAEVPDVVRAWVTQLLDRDTVAMIRAVGEEQVEIRLFANRGKARKRPTIIANGGPQEMVDIDELIDSS